MSVMRLAGTAAAFLLWTSSALAAPSPSPSLDRVLAPPVSSGYSSTSSVFTAVQGKFDAVDYLAVLGPAKPSATLATLKEDGFLQGHGRAWIDRTSGHILVELVVAFEGGEGARKWLPEARALAEDNDYFQGEISVSGIEVQYGGHFVNSAGGAYADQIGLVKGNDFFMVYVLSQKNDLADIAVRQARQQYDAAPASTIPPASWPENASSAGAGASSPPSIPAAVMIIAVVAGILFLAGVLLVVLLMNRSRSRPSAAQAVVSNGIQMSADSNYWWDGQTWREAAGEAPPNAHRSADGKYWWDGQKWREAQPPTS